MSNPVAANDVRRWQPPELGPARHSAIGNGGVRLPTAGELEQLQQTAQQEGYAAGRAEAVHLVKAEADRLQALLAGAAREWRACEEQTAEQIVALALTIAQGMLRQTLAVQPERIVAIVRDAVAQLPAFAQTLRIALHPADTALVREQLGETALAHGWQLVDDADLTRGDCKITQGSCEVDATLAQRWRSVTAALGSDLAWLPAAAAVEAAPALRTPAC